MALTAFSRESHARELRAAAQRQLRAADAAGFERSVQSMKTMLGADSPFLASVADELLLDCVERGFLAGAKSLADCAELKLKDSSGLNALFAAIDYGHLDIVRALWPHANPSNVDKQGRDALMVVAGLRGIESKMDFFELILSRSDPLRADPDNCDALFFAAESNHAQVTRRLAALCPAPLRVSAYGRDAFAQALLSRAWAAADELVPRVAFSRVEAALGLDAQMNPVPAGQMPRARALLERIEILGALSDAPAAGSAEPTNQAAPAARRL